MDREIGKPAPLSEEALFKARTSKQTFVNPKGLGLAGAINGHKMDAAPDSEEAFNKRFSFGEGLAPQGRPLK